MDAWETKAGRGAKPTGKAHTNDGKPRRVPEKPQKMSTAFQAGTCKPHSAECAKRLCPTSR